MSALLSLFSQLTDILLRNQSIVTKDLFLNREVTTYPYYNSLFNLDFYNMSPKLIGLVFVLVLFNVDKSMMFLQFHKRDHQVQINLKSNTN
ncbi:hypothetical protein DX888_24935 [Vibrio alginolyticus]|nr:hypothetical protein [Vibrio alginolyticus]EGR2553855.1 hypothetical protein [Vibrio alginolyticus]WAG27116.1 hypothetical protein EEA47_12550 [Vibrio alginolyticus]